MSKHDYSQNTVSNVSSTILNCKNAAQNTILSTESMSCSWDAGIIHNVVTWFEVLQINAAKLELEQLFQKADLKFGNVAHRILLADSMTSNGLSEGEFFLKSLKEKFSIIQEYSVQSVSITGVFDNLCSKILSVDNIDKYVSYNSETKKYEYDWKEISSLISKDDLSEQEYDQLMKILDTMIDSNGEIDLESLEKFLLYLYTDGNPYYTQGDTKQPSSKVAQNLIDRILRNNSEKYDKIKIILSILRKEGVAPMYWYEEEPDGILNKGKKWLKNFRCPTTYGGDLLPHIVIDMVDGRVNVKYSGNEIKYQSVSITDDLGKRHIILYDKTEDTIHVMDDVFEKINSESSCYNEGIQWLKDQLYQEEPDIADKITDELVDKIIDAVTSTCPIPGVDEFVDAIDELEELDEKEKERLKNNQYLMDMIQRQYNHAESIDLLNITKNRMKAFGVTGQITIEEHEDGCISFDLRDGAYKEDYLLKRINEFNEKCGESITISDIHNAVESLDALYGESDDLLSDSIIKFMSWSLDN